MSLSQAPRLELKPQQDLDQEPSITQEAEITGDKYSLEMQFLLAETLPGLDDEDRQHAVDSIESDSTSMAVQAMASLRLSSDQIAKVQETTREQHPEICEWLEHTSPLRLRVDDLRTVIECMKEVDSEISFLLEAMLAIKTED